MKKTTTQLCTLQNPLVRITFWGLFLLAISSSYAKSPSAFKGSEPLLDVAITTCAPLAEAALVQPVRSGVWSNSAIWPGGNLPTERDDVQVPAGITLTLSGTCRAQSIRVMGTLNANTQTNGAGIDLRTKYIMVMGTSAELEIGTEEDPYLNRNGCVITLTGNDRNEMIPGTNPAVNSKAIMVMNGATLELHGKPKVSWTNLAATAAQGATQITLREAVNWEVGDEIVLTSTTVDWQQVDEATITQLSADGKTITLAEPLNYQHVGGEKTFTRSKDNKQWTAEVFGEVGLLSHNIKIQGDEPDNDRGFGGHIMIMKGTTAHAENIELYKMGQKAILARYPWHWHLNEDQAKGSYIKNSSVHKSYNRGVTIHGTDYATVEAVVAYDHIGHGLFLEDGGERFNTIKNNLFFSSRRPKGGEELTPSDNQFNAPQNRTPSTYWITNPNNYFDGNVAAGTEGTGFWFAMPESPLFATGSLPYFNGVEPYKEPLGSFTNFVVHSSKNGFDLFDRLNDDHSIRANWGWAFEGKQYLRNGLLYANNTAVYCGLNVGGGPTQDIIFEDCIFTDNEIGTMLAANLAFENCLFNADMDLNIFEGDRSFYRFYDGPGEHINCHFEGWNRPNTHMIMPIIGGGATPNVNPSFRGTTKGFSDPFPLAFVANNVNDRPMKVNQFFKDYDGGLLGKANTTLVRDVPFNVDGHEYRHSSWRNAARSDYSFATIWLHHLMSTSQPLAVVRSKSGTSDVCMWDVGGSSGTYKYGVIVNQGFTYTYYLTGLPSTNTIHIIMDGGETGDLSMACYKGLGRLRNFRVTGGGLRELNSKAAVEAATTNSYFIDTNGDVYIKMSGIKYRRSTVDLRWDGVGSFAPVTPPCTSNVALLAASFASPTSSELEEGYESLLVEVDVSNAQGDVVATLSIDGRNIRTERVAPYQWGQPTSPNPGETLNLTAGEHTLEAVIKDSRGIPITLSKTITITEKEGSGSGDNITIPGSFEAEAFIAKEGSIRVESTPQTSGQNLGYILNNDATEYQLQVAQPGSYDLALFASSNGSGGDVEIYLDGALKGTVSIPPTGAWHQYEPYTTSVNLASGAQTLKLVYKGAAGYLLNLDKVSVTPATSTSVEGTVSLPAIHDVYMDNGRRINSDIVRVENNRRTTYLMFDLSAVKGQVRDAVLAFEVTDDAGNGSLIVQQGNHTNWTETNLTSASRPAASKRVGSYSGAFALGSKIEVPLDLSALPGDKLTLILEMNNGNDFAFGSKENAGTLVPQLTLNYAKNTPVTRSSRQSSGKKGQLLLYPNPVKSTLFVAGNSTDKTVKIYNQLGALQATETLKAGAGSIDVDALKTGVYLMQVVSSEAEVEVYKFIKSE